jgi:hypothetical protein
MLRCIPWQLAAAASVRHRKEALQHDFLNGVHIKEASVALHRVTLPAFRDTG